MTTYDRPVAATLIVRLDNGEEWEATPEDFAKFRLVDRTDAYMTFRKALVTILTDHDLLDGDLTDTALNPLRYLVETVICYPELLDHPDHADDWAAVAELERRLQRCTTPETVDA